MNPSGEGRIFQPWLHDRVPIKTRFQESLSRPTSGFHLNCGNEGYETAIQLGGPTDTFSDSDSTSDITEVLG